MLWLCPIVLWICSSECMPYCSRPPWWAKARHNLHKGGQMRSSICTPQYFVRGSLLKHSVVKITNCVYPVPCTRSTTVSRLTRSRGLVFCSYDYHSYGKTSMSSWINESIRKFVLLTLLQITIRERSCSFTFFFFFFCFVNHPIYFVTQVFREGGPLISIYLK